jgi:hypothetical protein
MKNAIEHLQQLHKNVKTNSETLGSYNLICRIIERLLPGINPCAQLNDNQVKHLWDLLLELNMEQDISFLSTTMVSAWINSCR